MNMERELTDIKFYVNNTNKDFNPEVFAIFLNEVNPFNGNLFLGYAHIGQHSEYHFDYIKESKEATENEYKDLYNELTNIVGYNLNVLNKIN